ncbi:ketosteroid isomerase [Fusarium albosuccineum]|uniref:Ketosteroid isomerase n=1 Tax=Fusarium albosuccineum TaxID=1237068 RepID=A0A8H4P761_9HYPO|nr:ketosteroid isomerase [Fusarium albosuccineum]
MSSFRLTRSHVLSSFAPLFETSDLARRNVFFTDSVIPNVAWTITGHAHSLVGTRYNIEDHCNISFNQLRKRLVAPIKFVYNDEGKIVEIRSYFDTVFAEQVLAEPATEE